MIYLRAHDLGRIQRGGGGGGWGGSSESLSRLIPQRTGVSSSNMDELLASLLSRNGSEFNLLNSYFS